MKNRFTAWRKPLGMAAAVALGLGSLTLATAPAALADNALTITAPGSAAAGSTVTVTVGGSFQSGRIELQQVGGGSLGTAVPILLPPPTVAQFNFTMSNNTSGMTVYAINYDQGDNPVGFSAQTTINLASGVQTYTTISAPNTVKVGTGTKLTVNVNALGGSAYAPTGNVVWRDQNGNIAATTGLTKNGNGSSYAYWTWTPTTAGTFIFTAAYQGDGVALPSTSAQDAINASGSGGAITLVAPGTVTVGVPVTLTATLVPASTQGSVGFTLNGNPISASIPIVNGSASMQWTPSAPGSATLGASFTTNGGLSGSTTDPVTIVAGPAQQDAITLIQPGWGPWAPNGTYTLGNGSNFTFQTSSLSGAPVTLAETGPCQVTGLTIAVPVGSGTCNLRASTSGGNGYAAVTYGYTVNLIPGVQSATLSAPVSGNYKVGRVLTLEAPTQQDTNAGQNISWMVKKPGRSVCKLLYPNSGSVTLRILKKGTCTVVGSAPGVPGQWQAFKTARKYTGR